MQNASNSLNEDDVPDLDLFAARAAATTSDILPTLLSADWDADDSAASMAQQQQQQQLQDQQQQQQQQQLLLHGDELEEQPYRSRCNTWPKLPFGAITLPQAANELTAGLSRASETSPSPVTSCSGTSFPGVLNGPERSHSGDDPTYSPASSLGSSGHHLEPAALGAEPSQQQASVPQPHRPQQQQQQQQKQPPKSLEVPSAGGATTATTATVSEAPPSPGVSRQRSSSRRNPWGNLSYADLITQAIQSSPDKRLTLAQIYEWLVKNVPYFHGKGDSVSSSGWKNSIRHNLSLHSRFVRVQNEGAGKSSWWMLNPDASKQPSKSTRRRANTLDSASRQELVGSNRTVGTPGSRRNAQGRGGARKRNESFSSRAKELRRSSSNSSLLSASENANILPADFSPEHRASVMRPRTSSNASSCGRLSPVLRSRTLSNASTCGVDPLDFSSSQPASSSSAASWAKQSHSSPQLLQFQEKLCLDDSKSSTEKFDLSDLDNLDFETAELLVNSSAASSLNNESLAPGCPDDQLTMLPSPDVLSGVAAPAFAPALDNMKVQQQTEAMYELKILEPRVESRLQLSPSTTNSPAASAVAIPVPTTNNCFGSPNAPSNNNQQAQQAQQSPLGSSFSPANFNRVQAQASYESEDSLSNVLSPASCDPLAQQQSQIVRSPVGGNGSHLWRALQQQQGVVSGGSFLQCKDARYLLRSAQLDTTSVSNGCPTGPVVGSLLEQHLKYPPMTTSSFAQQPLSTLSESVHESSYFDEFIRGTNVQDELQVPSGLDFDFGLVQMEGASTPQPQPQPPPQPIPPTAQQQCDIPATSVTLGSF